QRKRKAKAKESCCWCKPCTRKRRARKKEARRRGLQRVEGGWWIPTEDCERLKGWDPWPEPTTTIADEKGDGDRPMGEWRASAHDARGWTEQDDVRRSSVGRRVADVDLDALAFGGVATGRDRRAGEQSASSGNACDAAGAQGCAGGDQSPRAMDAMRKGAGAVGHAVGNWCADGGWDARGVIGSDDGRAIARECTTSAGVLIRGEVGRPGDEVHAQKGLRNQLIALLKEFRDVFAFTPEELTGIDPTIMEHKLNVEPLSKPIKQRLRRHGEEIDKAIEVDKLLRAGHVKEIQFPEWISNTVMVRKALNKWRMCIDFRDLNLACPKDHYPLPRIDQIVDSTAGCELLSMMDAYQGYHQIPLYPEDQSKVSFVTSKGT
ncbi:Unknown protein, partial [Striga hermonthica]